VILHDQPVRESIKERVTSLRSDTQRRWGKMTVDQMLWHLNCTLENALGRYDVRDQKMPLPYGLVKFVVFNLPWRRGKTPTAQEFIARERYDFPNEQARLLRLIDEMCAKPLDASWCRNSFMGPMTGHDWSRLQAKHLDHHLSQFGV
jgi:uncharacterized protein DUF1569